MLKKNGSSALDFVIFTAHRSREDFKMMDLIRQPIKKKTDKVV